VNNNKKNNTLPPTTAGGMISLSLLKRGMQTKPEMRVVLRRRKTTQQQQQHNTWSTWTTHFDTSNVETLLREIIVSLGRFVIFLILTNRKKKKRKNKFLSTIQLVVLNKNITDSPALSNTDRSTSPVALASTPSCANV
jgi:hypothetical protein